MQKYFFATGLFFVLALATQAQNDANRIPTDSLPAQNYESLSLEELLKLKASGTVVSSELEKLINSLIGVASQKAQSTRKSPSIVSLITEEEITASGARDLTDVLRLVPGFQFATDVQNTIGLGIRGNWAAEGKVLLLLDGQEMNETMYGTLQFGNHFDVSQIKRIEIIRGPGSAVYGGFAGYAVISIITKSADDLNGFRVTGTYGAMQNAYARRNLSFSAGKKFGDWGVSLSIFAGQGQRSDQMYRGFNAGISNIDTVFNGQEIVRIDTSYASPEFSMKGNSQLNPTNVNLGVTYKNWSFRGIYDDYRTTNRNGYGITLSRPFPNNFRSWFGELKYNWKISEKLTVTPRFNFKRQLPWQYIGDSEEYLPYHKQADRIRGSVTLNYDLSRRVNVVAGGEFFNDRAVNLSQFGDTLFYNGTRNVSFNNRALFAQTLFKLPFAHFTIGARYDYNDAFGSAFVPRLGITRRFDKLHLKLLYSNSFRAPSIENIQLSENNRILPERNKVIELEAGYQLSKSSILTVNVFDVHTQNPIVYNFTDGEAYQNFPRTGSSGAEMEYRFKQKWGFLTLTYAFYTTAWEKERIELYSVPGRRDVLLAFPAHQLGLNGNVHVWSGWQLNLSGSLLSSRYGYTAPDQVERFAPTALVNAFLRKQDLWTKGLEIGIGTYDLLNQKFAFIQPYNGGHAPLPGPSREFVARVSYAIHSWR